jgi:FkbM family methyltransferase
VSADDPLIGNAIRTTGVYEPEVSKLFHERLFPGACVLDIGANIGYFSMLAASLIGREGRVFAFEPLSANVPLLAASALVNQFRNIEIVAAAASDRIKTVSIGASYTNGMIGGLPQAAGSALGCSYVVTIPVDTVVQGKVDFLKIDVEGHEYRAIAGATETIRRSRPVIVSEFSTCGLEANSGVAPVTYLNLLRSLGYGLSAIGQPGAPTNEEILELARLTHHIDILADPI